MQKWMDSPKVQTKGFQLILYQVRPASHPLPAGIHEWTSTSTDPIFGCKNTMAPDQRPKYMHFSPFDAWHQAHRAGFVFEVPYCRQTEFAVARGIYSKLSELEKNSYCLLDRNNDIFCDMPEDVFSPHSTTPFSFSKQLFPYCEIAPIHSQRDQLVVYVFDETQELTTYEKCEFITYRDIMYNFRGINQVRKLHHKVLDQFFVYFGDDAALNSKYTCQSDYDGCPKVKPSQLGVLEVIIIQTCFIK